MSLVIGIDGGGTKTEGVALDSTGRAIARARSGGVNLNFVSLSECEQSVAEVLTKLAAAVEREQVALIYSVMLTDIPSLRNQVEQAFPHARWQGVHEHRAVLAAGGVLEPYGIGVVAGTGSSIVGWRGEHRCVSVGGWGMLLGDEGSATDIAIQALRAVVRAVDGRGEQTRLLQEAVDYFHLKHVHEITQRVYRDNLPRHILAGFAVRVSLAAESGDEPAQRILCEAGETLGEDTLVVARRLFEPNEEFPVVLGGGVFEAGERVVAPLRQKVSQHFPRARVYVAEISSAEGLARLALKDLER